MAAAQMTTFATFTTSAVSQTTAPPHFEDLRKRAGECGDLRGAYPNAVAPTCAGSYSICTFSAGQQGCCDRSNNCQFFTSCNGGLASGAAKCTAINCLQCPSATPYCTRYNFSQGLSAFAGFACGVYSLPGDLIVQGFVATGQPVSTSASSASGSTSTSKTGSSTSQTSRTSTGSAMSSTSTANPQPSVQKGVHLSRGAVIGIAIGGAVVVCFLLWVLYKLCSRNSKGRHQKPMLEPMRYQQLNRE